MGTRESAPEALSEMRLWLAGGEKLAAGLAPLCEVNVLRPDDWRERAREGAAFLLVEDESPWRESEEELDRLLDACEEAGVPTLLWITGGSSEARELDRCPRFERVFTVDRGQLPALREAGAREPWTLWPAAPTPEDEPPTRTDRSDTVLWLGGWRPQWPVAWRERLASVLRGAAERNLRILETTELDGLPADLERFVEACDDRRGALRGAGTVIGADPRRGSAELAPAIVFEAAAARTAVITPHDFLSFHDFAVGGNGGLPWRNTVPVVHNGEIAKVEIDRLREDEALREETLEHLNRILANNHTYAHRLATLASAIGLRLVPDAQSPTPA